MMLVKYQRNDIFRAIESAGLEPREFDLSDDDAEARIKHRWAESYFIIGGDAGHYAGHYVVGDGVDWPYEVYSWRALMERVSRWLGEVKHDLETPDLWAELRSDTELLVATSDETRENTPFTPAEQKEIARALQELGEDAKSTYALSAAQEQELDAKLDYLVDAAGRLGRTDWRGVFVGVMLSLVLSGALPPESVRVTSLWLSFEASGTFTASPSFLAANRLRCSPPGLPTDWLHEILKEAVQVRGLPPTATPTGSTV
jgi:hypothetical protein